MALTRRRKILVSATPVFSLTAARYALPCARCRSSVQSPGLSASADIAASPSSSTRVLRRMPNAPEHAPGTTRSRPSRARALLPRRSRSANSVAAANLNAHQRVVATMYVQAGGASQPHFTSPVNTVISKVTPDGVIQAQFISSCIAGNLQTSGA